jgi:hypothetical protein
LRIGRVENCQAGDTGESRRDGQCVTSEEQSGVRCDLLANTRGEGRPAIA